MATNEMQSTTGAGVPSVAKEAPTEQQTSQPGVPKRFVEGQTVCNEKNAKGKLCNGHLKQVSPIREESRQHMRGDDLLYKCQTCGALYMGPPLGHVRDPYRQRRFVMDEQNAILLAAGGTLPAFVRSETGALVPAAEPAQPAPAAKPAMPTPAAQSTTATPPATKPAAAPLPQASEPEDETPEQKRARKIAEAQALRANAVPIPGASGPPPEGETPEQKIARLQAVVAEAKRRKEAAEAAGGEESAAPVADAAPPRTTPTAATTSGTDSSPSADAHRPAAEAQAATGQASAAPLSAATATASPAAGAETAADLAPEASTELTPGAPRDEAPKAATPKGAARRAAPTPLDDKGMPLPPPHLAPPPGETHTEKIARLQAVVTEAKQRAGKH